MPSKKSPHPAPLVTPAVAERALSLAGSAAEARVRPGFSYSDAHDLLWAAGFPDIVVLADEHPGDADPPEGSLALARRESPGFEWPREATHRFVRMLASTAPWGMDARGNGVPSEEALRLAATPGPVSPAEALASIDYAYARGLHPIMGAPDLYAIEAVLGAQGPTLVLDAVVAATESLPDDSLLQWHPVRCVVIEQAGAVLYRAERARAAAYRARLEAVFARGVAAWDESHAVGTLDVPYEQPVRGVYPVRYLDMILHGAAGARRAPQSARFCDDDPSRAVDAVRAARPDKYSSIDPRLVFVGGVEALDLYLSRWRSYSKPHEHARMIATLGEVRAPSMVRWMLEMARDSKAKRDAGKWFPQHHAFARPQLEVLATDAELGPAARAALATLPTPS